MNYFWDIIASNALVAVVLAIGAVLLGRVWKNPAAIHLLWVLVLLKLFTPPIVTSQLPFAANWLPSAVYANSADRHSSSLAALDAIAPATPRALANSPGATGSDVANSEHRAPQDSLSVVANDKPWSLSTILAAIWILGSCGVAVAYAVRIRRFANLLQTAEPAPVGISMMVTQLASKLGLRRQPSVLMTRSALPPLVWSIGGRPRLILPSELFARLSSSAQATILAHELVHVGRRDYLVRLLELVATTVFWWHPVVWWACSQLRDLEEQCCDSRALELVPNQARTYASALVDTLEYLSEHRRVFVPLPTAVHSTGSLSRRIRMLTQNRTGHLSIKSVVFVAAISAYPLVVAFAGGESEPSKDAGPPISKSAAAAVAVLSGRVTNDAGEALAGVRVRVAIPATDMRFIDSKAGHKKFKTKSDAKGDYRLELPAITKPTTASIDAMKPGYRKLVGTLMSGGDVTEVKVAPSEVAEASFALKPSLYFKGIVVDEHGKPVSGAAIGAHAKYARSSGGVERTVSNADGSFELFNYSIKPFAHDDDVAKGTVYVSHPDYVSDDIKDVYALAQDEREALRIVLPTGYKVSGRLLDAAGKPVSKVMIEAAREKGDGRKATMTDANGRFVLRGLVGGPTIVRAHAMDIKQKTELAIQLDSDNNDLEVQLKPISLPTEPKTVAVLGLQLTDVTPDLQATYDLYDKRGALIFDPGKDSDRLKIGRLAEGYNFWMVGEKRVGSVREFIQQVLAEAAKQDTDEYSIRVVYSFRTLDLVGTNTQYLTLTKEDVTKLQGVFDELADK